MYKHKHVMQDKQLVIHLDSTLFRFLVVLLGKKHKRSNEMAKENKKQYHENEQVVIK